MKCSKYLGKIIKKIKEKKDKVQNTKARLYNVINKQWIKSSKQHMQIYSERKLAGCVSMKKMNKFEHFVQRLPLLVGVFSPPEFSVSTKDVWFAGVLVVRDSSDEVTLVTVVFVEFLLISPVVSCTISVLLTICVKSVFPETVVESYGSLVFSYPFDVFSTS